MANIIDAPSYSDPTTGYYHTGQRTFFGGGGNRSPLAPGGSEQDLPFVTFHRGVVPWHLGGIDSNTLEHYPTNMSWGVANQPVSGGIPAPLGLLPTDEWTYQHSSMGSPNVVPGSVAAPRSTDPTNPYGL